MAKYNLKPSERELLIFTRQHMDAIFVGHLATIAKERLGIPITEQTQYKLSDDFGSVEINEPTNDGAAGNAKATNRKARRNNKK